MVHTLSLGLLEHHLTYTLAKVCHTMYIGWLEHVQVILAPSTVVQRRTQSLPIGISSYPSISNSLEHVMIGSIMNKHRSTLYHVQVFLFDLWFIGVVIEQNAQCTVAVNFSDNPTDYSAWCGGSSAYFHINPRTDLGYG